MQGHCLWFTFLLFTNGNKVNEAEASVRMFSRFAAVKGF